MADDMASLAQADLAQTQPLAHEVEVIKVESVSGGRQPAMP